jgi:hypothetical protein
MNLTRPLCFELANVSATGSGSKDAGSYGRSSSGCEDECFADSANFFGFLSRKLSFYVSREKMLL